MLSAPLLLLLMAMSALANEEPSIDLASLLTSSNAAANGTCNSPNSTISAQTMDIRYNLSNAMTNGLNYNFKIFNRPLMFYDNDTISCTKDGAATPNTFCGFLYMKLDNWNNNTLFGNVAVYNASQVHVGRYFCTGSWKNDTNTVSFTLSLVNNGTNVTTTRAPGNGTNSTLTSWSTARPNITTPFIPTNRTNTTSTPRAPFGSSLAPPFTNSSCRAPSGQISTQIVDIRSNMSYRMQSGQNYAFAIFNRPLYRNDTLSCRKDGKAPPDSFCGYIYISIPPNTSYGNVVVYNASKIHQGKYVCNTSMINGASTSATFKLTVKSATIEVMSMWIVLLVATMHFVNN